MLFFNIHNGLAAWSNHTFVLKERCSSGGAAYECTTAGTSTAAPTGTGSNIANGGTVRFKWLSPIDYTNMQAWCDAMPGTQTDNYTVWNWNDGVITTALNTAFFGYFGKDNNGFSTFIGCAPGESFRNKVGVPLSYNPANGVAFEAPASGAENFLYFYVNVANTTIDGIQYRDTNPSSGSGGIDSDVNAVNLTVQNCLLDSTSGLVYFSTNGGTLINDILICRQVTGGGPNWPVKWDVAATGGKIINCTVIAPGGLDSILVALGGPGQVIVRNTAIFGCSTPLLCQNSFGAFVADHCLTDASSFNFGLGVNDAGNNLFSRTAANQFFNAATDFHLKTTADCIGAGIVDTTDNPSATDIFGNPRGSSWDIGAVESAPLLATATVAGLGHVTALGRLRLSSNTVFHGSGSVTANATALLSSFKQASALIAGVGAVAPRGNIRALGTAVLSGAGSVSVVLSGTGVITSTNLMPGVGSVTANAGVVMNARATIAGTAGFVANLGGSQVIVVADPIVVPVVPVLSVDKYLNLVPSFNAAQPNFMATMVANIQPFVDLQTFFQGMPEAFDLDTAVGAQLDVDGIWIGRTRVVNTPITDVYFSWDIDGLGWEEGNWQGAFDPDDGLTSLDDETYRQLLYAKRDANHWDGSTDGIVTILTDLFGLQSVIVRVYDNQDMTLTVNVIGTLNNLVFRALLLGGYIPIKPVGVSITYVLDTVIGGQLGVVTIGGVGSVVARARLIDRQASSVISGVGGIVGLSSVVSTSGNTATISGSAAITVIGSRIDVQTKSIMSGVGGITLTTSVLSAGRTTIAGVGGITTTTLGTLASRATISGIGGVVVVGT